MREPQPVDRLLGLDRSTLLVIGCDLPEALPALLLGSHPPH